MKTSKFNLSASLVATLVIAAGCAGISENTMTAVEATPAMNQADLQANTEVVTTIFNGNREQEQIIVIRPDL
jgi:hypothetical protein